jgi:hypothetical protein
MCALLVLRLGRAVSDDPLAHEIPIQCGDADSKHHAHPEAAEDRREMQQ